MLFAVAACVVLILHLLFIAWVVFGALLTRGRPRWAALHLISLVWGILVEVGPWPCPLTLAENWLEVRAGEAPYQGGFILHYLDRWVYPDLPPALLTWAAIVVVAVNAVVYARRFRRRVAG